MKSRTSRTIAWQAPAALLAIVLGAALLVLAFVYEQSAPTTTVRDPSGAIIAVRSARDDLVITLLDGAGGLLLIGGVVWCFVWAPVYGRRWRVDRRICPACGYDRRVAPHEPCPECGDPPIRLRPLRDAGRGA